MLYLNQLDYRHIRYNHNMDAGGAPEERRNVATSGCGLCSLCMIVDHLTLRQLSLEECVRLSEENGANRKTGTNMKILGPIVAKMYGLEMTTTNSAEVLLAHLRKGGEAIVNVGGDREGHIGLFSHVGHYMVILSADGDTLCILDPSYKEGKFDEEGRPGKVRLDPPFLYCPVPTLLEDTANRDPGFYLFDRKKGDRFTSYPA